MKNPAFRISKYTIRLDGDDLVITPPGELNEEQRAFLRENKPSIVSALKAKIRESEDADDLNASNDSSPIRVRCWTPVGDPVEVIARDEAHAAWVTSMNPQPTAPTIVRCCDCSHATIRNGVAKCGAGVVSRLPTGGWWATDRHYCSSFEEKS